MFEFNNFTIGGEVTSKKPDLSVHKNTLVIQVKNEVLDQGSLPIEELIDVESQLFLKGDMKERVDIKDVIVERDGKKFILHYIIYDLCHFNKDAYINLKIQAFDGSFTGFISAAFTELSAFSIKCIDKESETFIPREQHGSCESWDSKIWVFGGKRTVGKSEEAMNDIMVYDATKNNWKSIRPSSGTNPTPRFGHILFWYYQYLIVFGGQSESGKPLGDLWVFDTLAERWTFIMDTDDTHELLHYNIQGSIPKARMFASGVLIPDISAGYITGGMTSNGIAWDIWGLKLDKLVSHVEDKNKNPIENFWISKTLDNLGGTTLCRQGHVSAAIGGDEFVVYGGVSEFNEFMSQTYSFRILTNELKILKAIGEQPEARQRWGVLSTGGRMVILYGGAHFEKGYFIDLWHFVVNDRTIIFKKIDYTLEGDNLIMVWRHGFTMHYVRGEQDPILIGGTYGNNQQSQTIITLPEKKWADMNDFNDGICSPCPYGSVYSSGAWRWWGHNQYFYDQGFNSKCKNCPLGLVSGNYQSCVPCPGGYIYDYNYPSFCRQWTDKEICPMGTRYPFPLDGFNENFEEVRLDSYPDLFNPHKQSIDYVSISVVMLIFFLMIILTIIVVSLFTLNREKALFVFREIDIPFLTGGKRKVLGGVIVLYYFLFTILIILGFLINFVIFNKEVVMFETKNPYLNKSYPSSYIFKTSLYTSRFLQDETSSYLSSDAVKDILGAPSPNLWDNGNIDVSLSR